MFAHNLKLAVRQLLKYRLQSAVSIVSLAIGFACFSLAAMWIRYETTYDAFHKDAEGIYVLMREGREDFSQGYDLTPLREMPQFEVLAHIHQTACDSLNGKGEMCQAWFMNDTNFVSLVGLDIIEGRTSFVYNEHEAAVSDRLAKELWGNESPIGKPLSYLRDMSFSDNGIFRDNRTVVAVYRHWGEHSNFSFDMLGRLSSREFPQYFFTGSYLMGRIFPRVDVEQLNARLDTMPIYHVEQLKFVQKHNLSKEVLHEYSSHQHFKMVPITKVHYSTDVYQRHAKTRINHIYLFAFAGGLLIFCGLLNYLTIFLNRLFIRRREMALRTVFGASGWKLTVQFLIEYGLLLAIALLLGSVLVEWSLDEFYKLTNLPRNNSFFYRETFLYMSLVAILSLLISLPPIWYFRRQSLQSSIAGTGGLTRYNLFRRGSTGVQIGVSIFCIFCTMVMMKQINTLRHGDIGFERENRMVYRMDDNNRHMEHTIVMEFLKQCPEVDTLLTAYRSLYPRFSGSYRHLYPQDYPELNERISLYDYYITDGVRDFYGLTLTQGRWLDEGETDAMVVNETFARRMGWKNPIGIVFEEGQRVVGVVKDFQNVSPTAKAECWRLLPEPEKIRQGHCSLLIRYKEGQKQVLRDKLKAHLKEKGFRYFSSDLYDLTEEYSKLLTSEDNLQKLLTITTSVCILIALFGVWSMIMLTCEQRRKEIAVRKVHGATVGDILRMFFGEYMALLGVAAVVAFPVGYVCMKPWLEQYVVQTEISWWIYAGILAGMALLVSLCIGWRVWKAANSHPADEICKG